MHAFFAQASPPHAHTKTENSQFTFPSVPLRMGWSPVSEKRGPEFSITVKLFHTYLGLKTGTHLPTLRSLIKLQDRGGRSSNEEVDNGYPVQATWTWVGWEA